MNHCSSILLWHSEPVLWDPERLFGGVIRCPWALSILIPKWLLERTTDGRTVIGRSTRLLDRLIKNCGLIVDLVFHWWLFQDRGLRFVLIHWTKGLCTLILHYDLIITWLPSGWLGLFVARVTIVHFRAWLSMATVAAMPPIRAYRTLSFRLCQLLSNIILLWLTHLSDLLVESLLHLAHSSLHLLNLMPLLFIFCLIMTFSSLIDLRRWSFAGFHLLSFTHFLVWLLCLIFVLASLLIVLLIVIWILIATILLLTIELVMISASIHIGIVHKGLLLLVCWSLRLVQTLAILWLLHN